jgi:hypothetical protein
LSLASLNQIACRSRGSDAIFPDIVFPLFLFIDRLSRRLKADGYGVVYFLAREGQLLERLFRLHAEIVGGRGVETRYLHISRRAAFAASLAPLSDETFAPLFSQYFNVSPADFMDSLGFSAEQKTMVVAATGVRLNTIEADWSNSPIWANMRNSPVFAEMYETNRQERSKAFKEYARTIGLEREPSRIAVVDVGWRGTTQDYLAKLFAPKQGLDGYYLGLLRGTRSTQSNRKHGLLFAPSTRKYPLGRALNENRALFELMLAADHGAVIGYAVDEAGRSHPMLDSMEADWDGLREVCGPIRARIERDFLDLCEVTLSAGADDSEVERIVAQRSARMLLRPSMTEIDWFAHALHRENFGVFQMTKFSRPGHRNCLTGRMALGAEFLTGPRLAIGQTFWPVFTLREHGLHAMEGAYVRFRERQLGFSTEGPCVFAS